MLRWIVRSICLLFVLLALAYFGQPGSYRALTPSVFGMTQVEDGVFIDDPTQASVALKIIDTAKETSARFFPTPAPDPRYVICTTTECQSRFGVGSVALTLGDKAILIMPNGMSQEFFTHERVHVDLHSMLDIRDVWSPRFPAWFDEGLASHLSHGTRYTVFPPSEASWVMAAKSFRDWPRLVQQHGWPDTYGAAKSLVADLDQRLGRDGLLQLVQDAAETRDFEGALRRAVGRSWP